MSNTTFNAKDLNQISARGSELQSVEQQIDNFKKGFPFPCISQMTEYRKADDDKGYLPFSRKSHSGSKSTQNNM